MAGARGHHIIVMPNQMIGQDKQTERRNSPWSGFLSEGLEETLTVVALGVGPTLIQSLRSTNTIENLQGTLKRVARKVKRWRGGFMALRWAVSWLMEASPGPSLQPDPIWKRGAHLRLAARVAWSTMGWWMSLPMATISPLVSSTLVSSGPGFLLSTARTTEFVLRSERSAFNMRPSKI